MQQLGGIQHARKRKYLGLAMVFGRSQNSVFRFIKDNMSARVQYWKGKLSSNVGKEVLLKSIALALPSYAMSVVKSSDSIWKVLIGIMAKFWWGNDQGERRMHLIKWYDLSEIEGEGGFSFRGIQCFNVVLLAKPVGDYSPIQIRWLVR